MSLDVAEIGVDARERQHDADFDGLGLRRGAQSERQIAAIPSVTERFTISSRLILPAPPTPAATRLACLILGTISQAAEPKLPWASCVAAEKGI